MSEESPRAYLARIEAELRAQHPDLSLPSFTQAEIDAAFAAVPRFAQQVFLSCHVEGFCYVEIAERLGISERRVEREMASALTRLHRAFARIERRRRR